MAKNKKNFIYFKQLILFIASVLIAFFLAQIYVKTNTSTVLLDDNGFSEQTLYIEKGDTVKWKIGGKSAHWPASDPHPIHTFYPEKGGCIGSKLDACRPLKLGEEYSFKFDEIGNWGVHDHLFHASTMTVIVSEKKSAPKFSIFDQHNTEKGLVNIDSNLSPDKIAKSLINDCHKDQSCYAKVLESITKKRGYKFAFEIVDDLKKYDLAVAGSCHRLAHGIGWTTYQIDPTHWKENLRKIGDDCNWGAIHGIVEQYVAANKELDSNTIKTVCAGDGACNHGIGHMLLVQTNNNLDQALDLCEVLKIEERHMCMTGVFMERMTLQNLIDKENDSRARRMDFWENRLPEFKKLCESFKTSRTEACWEEISRPAVGIFNSDPVKVFAFCNQASQTSANYCRRRAVSEIISSKKFDMKGLKYMCELGPDYDVLFRRDCYLRIANLALVSLPKEKKNEISEYCKSIPSVFIKACNDILNGESLNESINLNSLN